MFNIEVAGDHTYFVGDLGVWVHNKAARYHQPPETDELTGEIFGKDLTFSRRKTPIQGGGKLRKRWKNSKGEIFEWDSKKGTLEPYNKRGIHLGEYTKKGVVLNEAVPGRRIKR